LRGTPRTYRSPVPWTFTRRPEDKLWDVSLWYRRGGSTAGFKLARWGVGVVCRTRKTSSSLILQCKRRAVFMEGHPETALNQGGASSSIIGKKRAATSVPTRGRILVLAQVDRQRSSARVDRFRGAPPKTISHSVVFPTCLRKACLKRGKSDTRNGRVLRSGRELVSGQAARNPLAINPSSSLEPPPASD